MQSGLLNERVLLKRPMFITCNKATASNPICTGNCCCWHGQRGLSEHPAGTPCDPGGEQAAAAKAIGSGPTQARALPSHHSHTLLEAPASVPRGIVWLWGAQHCSVSRRWWLKEHMVSSPFTKGYPERPRLSRMLGLNLCLFPPSQCLHRAAPRLHSILVAPWNWNV